MKDFHGLLSDIASIAYRITLACLLWQINNNLALYIIMFYLIHTIAKVIYIVLDHKEQEELLSGIRKQLENSFDKEK